MILNNEHNDSGFEDSASPPGRRTFLNTFTLADPTAKRQTNMDSTTHSEGSRDLSHCTSPTSCSGPTPDTSYSPVPLPTLSQVPLPKSPYVPRVPRVPDPRLELRLDAAELLSMTLQEVEEYRCKDPYLLGVRGVERVLERVKMCRKFTRLADNQEGADILTRCQTKLYDIYSRLVLEPALQAPFYSKCGTLEEWLDQTLSTQTLSEDTKTILNRSNDIAILKQMISGRVKQLALTGPLSYGKAGVWKLVEQIEVCRRYLHCGDALETIYLDLLDLVNVTEQHEVVRVWAGLDLTRWCVRGRVRRYRPAERGALQQEYLTRRARVMGRRRREQWPQLAAGYRYDPVIEDYLRGKRKRKRGASEGAVKCAKYRADSSPTVPGDELSLYSPATPRDAPSSSTRPHYSASSSSTPPHYSASSSSTPPHHSASSSSTSSHRSASSSSTPPHHSASSSSTPPHYSASSSSTPPHYSASSSSTSSHRSASSFSTPPHYSASSSSTPPHSASFSSTSSHYEYLATGLRTLSFSSLDPINRDVTLISKITARFQAERRSLAEHLTSQVPRSGVLLSGSQVQLQISQSVLGPFQRSLLQLLSNVGEQSSGSDLKRFCGVLDGFIQDLGTLCGDYLESVEMYVGKCVTRFKLCDDLVEDGLKEMIVKVSTLYKSINHVHNIVSQYVAMISGSRKPAVGIVELEFDSLFQDLKDIWDCKTLVIDKAVLS